MKNQDPVVNGYSRSVIQNLIETLGQDAQKCVREAAKRREGEDHYEVVGMRNFAQSNKKLIKMLIDWSMCEETLEHVTRHLPAFIDVIDDASLLLHRLTQNEMIQIGNGEQGPGCEC